MRIQFAHLNIQGIDVAVFDAKPTIGTDAARRELLSSLTLRARRAGLKVDKSALAYAEAGLVQFFGNLDLVRYLQGAGVPGWTNWLDV